MPQQPSKGKKFFICFCGERQRKEEGRKRRKKCENLKSKRNKAGENDISQSAQKNKFGKVRLQPIGFT